MSLGKIEQYIKKLEDVKNYDKIKAERDSLIAWVRELEKAVSHLSSRVKELEELNVLVEDKTLKENEENFLKA
jgi:arsenate reductase-like glutaredoxin family protein